jgi:hypothetical protein
MTIQRAQIIDNDQVFIASYTLDVIDCETREEERLEPFLLGVAKFPGIDCSITYRNQLNRIPITVFK